MRKFIQLYRKVGGNEILRQYSQARVLFFSLVVTAILGFGKKSLEIVRLAVHNRILCKLRRKYSCYIWNYVKNQEEILEHECSDKVWFLWLQGIEQAPELVKICYQSLIDKMPEKEIVLLTENNYRDYVTFPSYIQEKIDSGIITKTHVSDLMRLELLNSYGGTWVDATVYCSGVNIPDYMLNSELFLFQNLKPGLDGQCSCISSWFITASTKNPILLLTKDLLYEYWKTNTRMIDYFLFHDFFQLAIEAFPEEWNKVIPFSNSTPHILLLRLFEKYDEKLWNAIMDQTPFHKLSYKYSAEQKNNKGTYYNVLFEEQR